MMTYNGDPSVFHEWSYRTEIKMKTIKKEELLAFTAKVVDALRGNVLACVMGIGIPNLMDDGGLELRIGFSL